MKVAVLGSGAGALAVAADMARCGRRTVLAGLDDDRPGLDPVAAAGTVALAMDAHDEIRVPVAVAGSIQEALAGAELAVVAVPCQARRRWVQAIAPHATPHQTVLVVGDGGGAILARRAIEPPTVVAETNTWPLAARVTGPGAVHAVAKRWGVLVAVLPPNPFDVARVMELVDDVWPQAGATDMVWTTVLTAYDALGTAPPEAADAIEAAAAELLALRGALYSRELRGYRHFRSAQGPAAATDANATAAPDANDSPCALVLASSLGRAAGVPTPAIDGLLDAASAGPGGDPRAVAPTLASLGLGGLDVTGLIGFARSGYFP